MSLDAQNGESVSSVSLVIFGTKNRWFNTNNGWQAPLYTLFSEQDLFISMFGNVPSVFQIVPSLLNDF